MAGDISTVMSPRTVITWAENMKIFDDRRLCLPNHFPEQVRRGRAAGGRRILPTLLRGRAAGRNRRSHEPTRAAEFRIPLDGQCLSTTMTRRRRSNRRPPPACVRSPIASRHNRLVRQRGGGRSRATGLGCPRPPRTIGQQVAARAARRRRSGRPQAAPSQ